MDYEELKREEQEQSRAYSNTKTGHTFLTKPLTTISGGVLKVTSAAKDVIKKAYLSEGPNLPSMMPITRDYLSQVGIDRYGDGVEVKALKIADVCRQGCHDIEEISMATGIDKNEVNRILGELKKAGYAFYVEKAQ